MTATADLRVVQSFSNLTGTSPGFSLPGGFYAMSASGDGSDASRNAAWTITVQQGTTILATLNTLAAGTNSTSIPGYKIQPVGYDYVQFQAPDGPAQTLTVVVAGGTGPVEVQIWG